MYITARQSSSKSLGHSCMDDLTTERSVPAFNSCPKCLGSPGIIHYIIHNTIHTCLYIYFLFSFLLCISYIFQFSVWFCTVKFTVDRYTYIHYRISIYSAVILILHLKLPGHNTLPHAHLQCRQLIPALNAWAARAWYITTCPYTVRAFNS